MDDGTRRDSVYETLAGREARYRTLMEVAFAGILLGQDGVITDVSPPLLARSGYTLDELIGRPVTDVVAEEFRDVLRQYQAAGADRRFDAVAVLKDGRRLPIEVVTKTYEIRGRQARMTALRDVTEQQQAQEALRGSQERLQLALQATGLGPWDWDLTTDTVEFWPEWKRQLGYEPDQIPNRYEEWENRLHPDDRKRVLIALRAYLDGREPEYALEFRLRHKDGTYRWIYTRGVVHRDASGRQTHMLGCHLDITERKQLEDQYRQSQKMQAIGQLAGGIAHDFNNLLVVINGYSEMVADELGPAHRSRPDLDEIRAAAASAATLTRQLLAFSRRQILQPQVLDLNQVLGSLQNMLGRIIGENITVEMKLAALARVSADPGQIEQVIMNLAVNARDAMPNGGQLLIETADVDLDALYAAQHPGATRGRHVMIAISDTGVGIDDGTRARLFEPFFTTKPPGRGTGLGLATVYGIVKQSGGSIGVYSERGQGTTFKIYLPVATAAPAPAAEPVDTRALRGTETVLVVEDQATVRTLIERTLRRFGYTVVVAATGSEAVVAARRHDGPIHVLLTDVVLAEANGREVARQLLGDRPTVRVVYMSGTPRKRSSGTGSSSRGSRSCRSHLPGKTWLGRSARSSRRTTRRRRSKRVELGNLIT